MKGNMEILLTKSELKNKVESNKIDNKLIYAVNELIIENYEKERIVISENGYNEIFRNITYYGVSICYNSVFYNCYEGHVSKIFFEDIYKLSNQLSENGFESTVVNNKLYISWKDEE